MARKDVIEQRLSQLTGDFARYVQEYDRRLPFTSEQLAAHRQCISLRQQAGSVRAAIADERFIAALRHTLYAWGIGRRASRLVPEAEFVAALQAALPRLEELEPLLIDSADLPADVSDRLWLLISSLGVVENQAKLVAGTKCPVPLDALHIGSA